MCCCIYYVEVIFVNYKRFYPGDEVITIVDYRGVPAGTVGTVASKWSGTAYVVRAADGKFRWINSTSLNSINPSDTDLKVGDIGVASKTAREFDFAEPGDLFKVYKVVDDVDYYGVLIGNEIKWFGGFQLAEYE